MGMGDGGPCQNRDKVDEELCGGSSWTALTFGSSGIASWNTASFVNNICNWRAHLHDVGSHSLVIVHIQIHEVHKVLPWIRRVRLKWCRNSVYPTLGNSPGKMSKAIESMR